MANNSYSTKTSISIYKFDDEDSYRQWLGSNKSKTNDILAFVKNPVMNNGLDVFINGHSISKTKFFLYSGGRSTEITSSSTFNPAKQYVLKSITRNGLGEKQMVTLEEIDIAAMQAELSDNILTTAGEMMDEKIETYMEEHPFEIDMSIFNGDKYNQILTHNHYMLRKLFSLIYRGSESPINMEAALLDDNEEEFKSYTVLNGSNATAAGVLVNISGAEGYDVVFSQLLVMDTYGNILKRIDGRNVTSGRNVVMFNNPRVLTQTSTFSIRLGYTINNWPSSYKNSLVDNFDKPAEIGTLNKTGINDMATKEIVVTFKDHLDDDPIIPDSVSTFFLIAIPTTTAPSSLSSWETVSYLTSGNTDSTIKISRSTNISSLKVTPSVDSWIYVALPYSMESGTIQVQPSGGFPDTITQRINTGNYGGKLYALYKEDYAQDAKNPEGKSLTYKVVYDE